MKISLLSILVAIGVSSTGGPASAVPIVPYAGAGENPITYTFLAVNNGPVGATFAGSSADYGSKLGLSINGAAPAFFSLQNHLTPVGFTVPLGVVSIGDVLRFILDVSESNPLGPPPSDHMLNSDASLNPGGDNHIYSYAYAGDVGLGLPPGTYVGFEDIIPITGSDYDYNDHQFIFTNVSGTPTNTVPEGGSMIALLGFTLLGLEGLRRKLGIAIA